MVSVAAHLRAGAWDEIKKEIAIAGTSVVATVLEECVTAADLVDPDQVVGFGVWCRSSFGPDIDSLVLNWASTAPATRVGIAALALYGVWFGPQDPRRQATTALRFLALATALKGGDDEYAFFLALGRAFENIGTEPESAILAKEFVGLLGRHHAPFDVDGQRLRKLAESILSRRSYSP